MSEREKFEAQLRAEANSTIEQNMEIACPLCLETGFDAIGFKLHILKWCEVFDTPTSDPVKSDEKDANASSTSKA